MINKYGRTYLVKAESNHLHNLKRNLKNYQQEEQALVNAAGADKTAARIWNLDRSVRLYDILNQDLRQLTPVQTEVGKQLLAESDKSRLSSIFITQLLLIIAVILGLIIVILVVTGKQVMVKQENYNIN